MHLSAPLKRKEEKMGTRLKETLGNLPVLRSVCAVVTRQRPTHLFRHTVACFRARATHVLHARYCPKASARARTYSGPL